MKKHQKHQKRWVGREKGGWGREREGKKDKF
jgi:hypothetical protein